MAPNFMKTLFTVVLLVCSALAQIPRPYVAGGVSLMPDGYHSIAYRLQGGIDTEAKHFVSDIYAAYDDGRKVNDGTERNIHGHDRYLHGFVALKLGETFFGAGASWSQLSTTNYVKGLNLRQAIAQGDIRPVFVAGHDWLRDNFSMRGQVVYITPPLHESVSYPGSICSGCGNGVQGPEFSVILPSPATKSHFFFRTAIGIYEYHTTITEPSNAQLTAWQDADRHVTGTTDFMLMYRF